MCGIAGIFRLRPHEGDTGRLRSMTDLAAHRGPEGEGFAYFGPSGRDGERLAKVEERSPWTIGLGHRRLKILDLSDKAAQPMTLPDPEEPPRRGLWMLYNGEIYNYVELRSELASLGWAFRTTGDSEVLLAAYREWGTACFERLRGMWALAIVDLVRDEVVLSRDRLGIKPLYTLRRGDSLFAASEIKQFTALAEANLRAHFATVADYLMSGYEQPERTFFESVEAFPAGVWRRIRLQSLETVEEETYWRPEEIEPAIDDPDEAADRFRDALIESVRLHLRSDVPIAVSLSGGLDSGSIAAVLASELDANGLDTFTASFPGDTADERRYVERLTQSPAQRSAFRPHFVTPEPEEFLAELDAFVWQHDEPVGSLSQYAGYRIAREIRHHGISVTLNGQGGDEILGGYWQSYFAHLRRLLHSGHLFELSRQLGGALLPYGNREALRQPLFLLRRYRQRRTAGGSAPQMLAKVLAMPEVERRLFEIRRLFLPRLLRWDDRNLMAFSVEGRYPFLDHIVIETALQFKPRALYRAGWTKLPLRRAMKGRVPPEILQRRDKQGFETPQERWCRGPLAAALERFVASDSPVWSIIDRTQISPRPTEPESHQGLVRALLVDRWIDRFDVRVSEAA